MSVLFDSGSKVITIYPTFAQELGLSIRQINVRAQKINGTILNTFGIVVAVFSVIEKANRVRFFEKTFLVANISLEMVFGILFLILSNADINFSGWKLRWRTSTTKKALSTTRYIEIVGNIKFAAGVLDPEHKTYIVHVESDSSVASLSSFPLELHVDLFYRPRMFGLVAKKTFLKISAKYSDLTDVFSPNLGSKFHEHTGINNHAIKLVDD